MEEITFDLATAIDAGQSWIDHDKDGYDKTYDWAHALGSEIDDALVAGAFKDRKAMALKLNETWGITPKGAETRCRRAHVIACADPKGVLKYDTWAGADATVAGLVAWIDNGYKAPTPPVVTPPVKLTAKQVETVETTVAQIEALLKGKPAAVKAAIIKKLA